MRDTELQINLSNLSHNLNILREKTSSEISSQVAKELANSKTVGWFQGRIH